MFNKHDVSRNQFMLDGKFAKRGYDWWWHSFTAVNDATGEEKPFFIEYFVCNPALAEEKPVLAQKEENKAVGKKPSYLMVKAGCWCEGKGQLHRFFSLNDVHIRKGAPYFIEAGDCYASETAIRGSVHVSGEDAICNPEFMSNDGDMEWNLTVDKEIAFNVGYGTSPLFRKLKAFEMYWHAEGIKTKYSGTIKYNGESYTVTPESSYGYADKNWGNGFTSPWVWMSSCCLVSNVTGKKLENSAFDIGGGKPKVFGISLDRRLLSAFWYEGKCYEFNFSKFWTGTRTLFSYEEDEDEIIWHVDQSNRRNVVRVEGRCKKYDMLFINYEDPDGNKKFSKLWNGGNGTANIKLYSKKGKKLELIDDINATHMGCEYGEFDW